MDSEPRYQFDEDNDITNDKMPRSSVRSTREGRRMSTVTTSQNQNGSTFLVAVVENRTREVELCFLQIDELYSGWNLCY